MTGADSPVMADSSTEAAPSMTSPSPGMSSPALHEHDVAFRELRGVDRFERAVLATALGHELLARGAQRPRLGLAAALGDGLGEVGEDHGEEQPERDLQDVAERLLRSEELLEREHRADQRDEHHRDS